MIANNFTYLEATKMRQEHDRNQTLTRVKTLEQERNAVAEELSRLDQRILSERHAFACSQQNLERTLDEMSQWRYPQGDESMWFQ
jgi:hypothetical protein